MKFSVLAFVFFSAFWPLSPVHHSFSAPAPTSTQGFLFVANQGDHTALLVNLDSKQVVNKAGVDINGHEVAVSADHRYGFVPIYGNSGVGKPGTDGSTVHVVDLRTRPHRPPHRSRQTSPPALRKIRPDGMLYVQRRTCQCASTSSIPQPAKSSAKFPPAPPNPTCSCSRPTASAPTLPTSAKAASALSILQKRSLVTVIPVAKKVQRISISADGTLRLHPRPGRAAHRRHRHRHQQTRSLDRSSCHRLLLARRLRRKIAHRQRALGQIVCD